MIPALAWFCLPCFLIPISPKIKPGIQVNPEITGGEKKKTAPAIPRFLDSLSYFSIDSRFSVSTPDASAGCPAIENNMPPIKIDGRIKTRKLKEIMDSTKLAVAGLFFIFSIL